MLSGKRDSGFYLYLACSLQEMIISVFVGVLILVFLLFVFILHRRLSPVHDSSRPHKSKYQPTRQCLLWLTTWLFQIMFESYGPKQGPLHGLLISTPYQTKDQLQNKRFQAQLSGTTYVYDYPELFKQVGLQSLPQYSTVLNKYICTVK